MGLACSKIISTEMGGDVTVHQSQENLTIFKLSMPVKVKKVVEVEELNYTFYLPNSKVDPKAFTKFNILLEHIMSQK